MRLATQYVQYGLLSPNSFSHSRADILSFIQHQSKSSPLPRLLFSRLPSVWSQVTGHHAHQTLTMGLGFSREAEAFSTSRAGPFWSPRLLPVPSSSTCLATSCCDDATSSNDPVGGGSGAAGGSACQLASPLAALASSSESSTKRCMEVACL